MTQILLDRGLGAAGVAIAPAPVKGVFLLPHRAVPLTPEQFHYAFTNNMSEEESLSIYKRYAVPGLRR